MSDLKPLRYFQSLNRSSNARSRAVFILFYINRIISASITDFCFFFLSLSFFFLSLILPSPHSQKRTMELDLRHLPNQPTAPTSGCAAPSSSPVPIFR